MITTWVTRRSADLPSGFGDPPGIPPVFLGGVQARNSFCEKSLLIFIGYCSQIMIPHTKKSLLLFCPSKRVGLLHVSLKHHKNSWIAHILKPFQSDLQNTHPLKKGQELLKAWKSWGKFRIQVSCYSLRVRWHVEPTQTPAEDHRVDSTLRVGLGDICVIYIYIHIPWRIHGWLVYLPTNSPYKSTSKCR